MNKFNGLEMRPKNRQVSEIAGIQGFFREPAIFSAGLSTDAGDAFTLVPALGRVQPKSRIRIRQA
jgi:hypothetical protein